MFDADRLILSFIEDCEFFVETKYTVASQEIKI
jgi:hypothetical protein